MSKRFFAFGCSVTEYLWPTWADVISYTLHRQGYECYNFGNSGGGNFGILASMVAANQRYKFNKNDIICVMWSSWNREDRYVLNYGWDPGLRGQWSKEGNILMSAGHLKDRFGPKFVEKYWCLENDIATNVVSIQAARSMFDITFEATIPTFEGDEHTGEPDTDTIEGRIFHEFLQLDNDHPHKWEFEAYGKTTENKDAFRKIMVWDGHPLPYHHMLFVKHHIQHACPNVKLVDGQTESWVNHFMNIMTEIIEKWSSEKRNGNSDNAGLLDMSWRDEVERHYLRFRDTYTTANRTDLWNDEIFIELLQGFEFKNYKN